MLFIFANALFFDDMFRLYEFQEKLNIEYQLEHRAKSEDFHDDLRGSQGRNIEYQQGPRAKVDVFMVCGKGAEGRMRTGIVEGAALPQTPNQRKTWKPEALIADT